MKVLMTCDAVGGVWQYATDLARGLAGRGVDVVLAVLGPAPCCLGPLPTSTSAPGDQANDGAPAMHGEWMPAQGGPGVVHVIPTNLPLDWLAAGRDEVLAAGRAIAALAEEHDVDLIHLNAPAFAAAGSFPAPVVAVAHGCVGTWFAGQNESVPEDLGWHEQLMRTGLAAADVIVAPTASYAAAVQHHYGLGTPPCVVHNGRTPLAMANAGTADHVLTAGRLWDRVKCTQLLDRVAAQLTIPLRAAGPVTGPNGETVATEHLHLLGRLDAPALAHEYAQGPIFVSAARFEPFGLAVLEAAQAGCALILSGIDSFRELWNGAALIVNGDEPERWVAAIERVRGDVGLRAHLSQQAKLRAARYSVDAMTAGTLGIYRGLLAEPERQAA